MDTQEALQVLNAELDVYQAMPYAALVRLMGDTIVSEKYGPSGTQYQIELDVVWDGQPNATLRIIGSIDDGGWRAFFPLTRSLIKEPPGGYANE